MEWKQVLKQKQYWKILFLFVVLMVFVFLLTDKKEERRMDGNFSYKEFISNIYSTSDTLSTISIFRNNTETIKKNKMIKKAYEAVRYTEVEDGDYEALDAMMNNKPIGILCIIFALVFVNLMIDTQNIEMSRLLFSLQEGRTRHMLQKVVSLFVGIVVFLLISEIGILLCSIIKYGLVQGLFYPVQSMYALRECIIPINVLGYFVIDIVLKIVGLFTVSLLMLIIKKICRSNISFVVATVGLVATEYLLWGINEQSKFCLLKYLNIWNLISPNNILSRYSVVSIGCFLFGSVSSYGIFLLAMIGLEMVAVVLLSKRHPMEIHKKNMPFVFGKGNELFKIVVEQKAYIAIVVAGAIIYALIDMNAFTYIGSVRWSQSVYEQYQGHELDEIGHFLSDEKREVNKIVEDYNRASFLYEAGDLTDEEFMQYENALINIEAKHQGIVSVTKYYDYLIHMSKTGKNVTFINTRPYESLWNKGNSFNGANYHDQELYSMIATLFVFMLIANLFSHDKDVGMDSLIRSLPLGREELFRKRCLIMMIICVLTCGGIYFWEFYQTKQLYGFDNWTASIQSIMMFRDFPIQIPIWAYFVFIEMGHVIGLYMLCWIEIAFCMKLGSQKGMIVSIVLVVGPELLHYLGVEEMQWLSLTQIMQMTERIAEYGIWTYLLTFFVLLVVEIIFLYAVESKKENMRG